MESEKVKEIKDALYCWQESVMLSTDGNYVSHRVTNREILDYINELESENKRLSDTEIGELIKENEELANQCEGWCEIILKKKNQIVELKDRIAELENQMCKNEDLHTATEKLNNAIILKQFVERLKEKDLSVPLHKEFIIIDKKVIDETLKEFMDEQ